MADSTKPAISSSCFCSSSSSSRKWVNGLLRRSQSTACLRARLGKQSLAYARGSENNRLLTRARKNTRLTESSGDVILSLLAGTRLEDNFSFVELDQTAQ